MNGLTNNMVNGQTTVGTSVVQLTTDTSQLVAGVVVKALAANTGKIYVGKSSSGTPVSAANGFELSAGQSATFRVTQPADLWAISDTAGQTVCWHAE